MLGDTPPTRRVRLLAFQCFGLVAPCFAEHLSNCMPIIAHIQFLLAIRIPFEQNVNCEWEKYHTCYYIPKHAYAIYKHMNRIWTLLITCFSSLWLLTFVDKHTHTAPLLLEVAPTLTTFVEHNTFLLTRRKSRLDQQEETIGSYFISVKLGHKQARPPCHAMWVLTVISALSKHQMSIFSTCTEKRKPFFLIVCLLLLVFPCMFPRMAQ